MLGLVLGPEAPLIAVGVGLGVLSLRRLRKDAPQQALALMGAAGSFAAVSTIFGSPVIGAVLIIEAMGIGGALLPVVLLPGLIAAGHRLARLHRARVVDGVQHERLGAQPVPAAALRRPGRRGLRVDDPPRGRRRGRGVRRAGAGALVGADRAAPPLSAHGDRRPGRRPASRSPSPRAPTSQSPPSCSRARTPSGTCSRRRPPSPSRPWRCSSSARAPHGASRSAPSAAVPRSRRSSWAPSPA